MPIISYPDCFYVEIDGTMCRVMEYTREKPIQELYALGGWLDPACAENTTRHTLKAMNPKGEEIIRVWWDGDGTDIKIVMPA